MPKYRRRPSLTKSQINDWKNRKRREALTVHADTLREHFPIFAEVSAQLPPPPPHGSSKATRDAYEVVLKDALTPVCRALDVRWRAAMDACEATGKISSPDAIAVLRLARLLREWTDAMVNTPPPPPPAMEPRKVLVGEPVKTPAEKRKEARELRAYVQELFSKPRDDTKRHKLNLPQPWLHDPATAHAMLLAEEDRNY